MKYKPEIDGLRSVAVLSVVLFHLGTPYIPGGFTGVDIFFVISGYLITGIIADEMHESRFSLADFYRRRALRILPPLLVVLAITSLISLALLLPVEVAEYGQTLVWSVLFFSNVYFYKEINYFNPEAKFNPLLHTWSLAVEEQFYIIVPIILWILFRYFKNFIRPLFVFTVIVSFVLSAVFVFISQSATFYMLPTRYWEMGVGAILALYKLHQVLSGRNATLASLIGATLIGASLVLINEDLPFPGPTALLSTIGTALIIMAGANSPIGKLLSKPGPIFVGKISYSLYLWHWPLIVFYRLWVQPDIDFQAGILIGAAAFILAVLSYYFVETPFRRISHSVPNSRVLGVAGTGLALFAGIGLVLPTISANFRPLSVEAQRIAAFDDYDETSASKAQYRVDTCFITSGTKGGARAFQEDKCLGSTGEGKRDYLLIGDSQAAHLWQDLQEARPDINLKQATASGCKPVLDTTGDGRCVSLMTRMLEDWVPSHPLGGVILSARWQQEDLVDLEHTIAELRENGINRIVVLGPTVEYSQSLPLILAREAIKGTNQASEFKDEERMRLDEYMEYELKDDGVTYLSVYDAVCPNDKCVETINGVPVQSDYGHFTDVGAAYVSAKIAPKL
jgi:peptidoglycan/LPS O-acetylase OafA/YrhL